MHRLIGITVAVVALGVSSAFAAVPTQMTVQGKLTDATGDPLPAGVKTFVFRIFDAQSAGTEIWPGGGGETQFISTDAAGLWNANVGAVTPLTTSVFAFTPRWLQITVNDGQTLTTLPRTQLVTSPYAQRVATVDRASGGVLTSGLDMPYAPSTMANNASGIRWWNGSRPSTAYGFIPDQGLWFQGADSTGDDVFGVRGPTPNGSLGPVVFRVDQYGNVDNGIATVYCGDVQAAYFLQTEGFLTVYGNASIGGYLCAQGGTTCPSDLRFKEKIETLSDALRSLERLRGVRYEWRRDEFPDRKFAEGEQVGLIAQEVQEVVPQAVQKMEDGYLAVDYTRLVPLLIEGMKEQQKQIEEMKARLDRQSP